jgi:roadblock/LC7 domain-containing protein
VVDGQAGPEFDSVMKDSPPVFSTDGKHVAYAAQRGDKWLVVVDGQAGLEFEGISLPVFSPDGKRVAYTAKRGEKWLVVVDGEAGPEFDVVSKLVFSPDGKRVAYGARSSHKQFMVVDGQAMEFDGVFAGFQTFDEDGKLVYIAIRGRELYRVTSRP